MALKFLQTLAGLSLPYTTSHLPEILHIETLSSANLIKADVPAFKNGDFVGPAVVHSITGIGAGVADSLRQTEMRKAERNSLIVDSDQ